MKKEYIKPLIEIEAYELDAQIAANCGNIVNLGPEGPEPGGVACSDYGDSYGPWALPRSSGISFYQSNLAGCDCYYSSGGEGYFTS